MPGLPCYHFAYVFERFPTFTQTFCVREVNELRRMGLRPLVFSIRDTSDESLKEHFSPELREMVHVLPPRNELVAIVNEWKKQGDLPKKAVLTLRHWGERGDKNRIYEAIYIGMKMRECGVRHAHSHFAGIGARCGYWLKNLYGLSFSFTGHANDIFEPTAFPVKLEDLMQEAAAVVTVSDYTAAWLGERFPRQRRKIRRVYNGIDMLSFSRERKGREGTDVPLVVSVGRLIEKKGFDDLVKSVARLKEIHGQPFRVLIVGDGPMREELEQLIERLGCSDRLQLAGSRNQSEIVEILEEATIFALPCVTEKAGGKDNLPTVIMEAMASGLPCVSTRLAGVPEMVVEGNTGLLTEERDPDAFAHALASLLADNELCRRMGIAGYGHASKMFAKESTARDLLNCLVAYGNLRFDPGLAMKFPVISLCYIAQWFRRLVRWSRGGGKSKFPGIEETFKLIS
ncbi:MAG: glycosyltransferase family 4 protein [Verrucomicrobiaceae bacterium]|nr:glycosyltransferase family 4 protein [Verrucomicrobiaceae bacterium]